MKSVDEIRTTRQSQRPNPFHAAASRLLPPIVSPPPEAGRFDVEELSRANIKTALAGDLQRGKPDLEKLKP
ncbi:hypothetical protein Bca4012_030409 [Brassica carinata]|uniref:Uncharacterized protein n=1 Tax=Brassica oleracea TaxID=3712 RepID=A0A3P6C584_BRAOL|nr:unnamed protein product [Brassica oleracea]